jgi:hypothetical protein
MLLEHDGGRRDAPEALRARREDLREWPDRVRLLRVDPVLLAQILVPARQLGGFRALLNDEVDQRLVDVFSPLLLWRWQRCRGLVSQGWGGDRYSRSSPSYYTCMS